MKAIYTIIFLFLSADFLLGQVCTNPNSGLDDCENDKCAEKILSQDINTNCTQKDYSARDIIKLKPNFHFKPQTGQKLHGWVDKTIVLPADYNTPFTQTYFDNRQINTNLPVGRIEGAANVSPSGSANYSIPISLPPGTGGMVPNLSLVFNSQVGNGPVGWGWNIAGLSVISRVPSTIYNDNKTGAITLGDPDYPDEDRFSLDGNRLLSTSGLYGENGTIYKTEVETFSKITSLGTLFGDPIKFEVQTKDGMKMEYGFTNDSKYAGSTASNYIFWRINKIYDTYGNFVEFKYINQNQESRIDEILYTGNTTAGILPYNKIKFIWDERLDKNRLYVGGMAIDNNVILNKIEIICENKKIKTYEFKYNYEVYSYLNEIIEYGNGGAQLNSTIFKYGEKDIFSYPSPTPAIPVNGAGAVYWVIDYNGDGKSDLVQLVYDIITGGSSDKEWTEWNLFKNNGGDSYVKVQGPEDFQPTFQPYQDFYPLNKDLLGNMIMTNTDFNGDGFDDLIFSTYADNGLFTFYPYLSDGATLVEQPDFEIDKTTTLRFLDFDGDQRMDIFTHNLDDDNNGQATVRFNVNFDQPISSPTNTYYDFTKCIPVDLDGDGRTELANIRNTNSNTYYLLKYNTSNELLLEPQPTIEGINGIPKFFGDFNGDGKTDIFYTFPFIPTSPDYGKWWINFSSGHNIFNKKEFTEFGAPQYGLTFETGEKDLSHYVIDANGDGKSDIIEINGSNVDVFISNGLAFTKYPNTITGWSISGEVDFGDFNGDGDMEMFVNEGGWIGEIHIIDLGFDPASRLIHEISDGFNQKTAFQYSPLTQGANFYTKGNSLSYPVSDYQGPLYAVSSLTIPDGVGGTRQTDYKYEGAEIHKQGKGFLSFSKITSIDNSAGIKSEVNYSQISGISPIIAHSVCSTKTIATNGNNIISETSITNEAKTYTDNRFFPFVSQSVTVNNLKGQTITSALDYNDDGNLTSSTVIYGSAETETSTYTYVQRGSWLPNRIETQDVTKTRAGDIYSISNFYDYYSNGKLKEQRVFNGKAKEVKTGYTYNALGNLTITTVSSNGLLSRTATINEYDTKGRFATKSTNPLGQISEAHYDPKWGTPLMQKGIDGLITTYEYDAFGRMTKMKTPDNIETNYGLNFAIGTVVSGIGGIPLNGLIYSSTVHRDGSPSSTVWYDIYGRVIKTQTDGFTEPINVVNLFNSKGQLEIATAPFYDEDIPEIKTYLYQTIGIKTGLLKNIFSYNDGTVTYNYSYPSPGLFKSTITNPNGKNSSQTTDASGKVVSADDDNGTTLNYAYYGHGQLKEVTLAGQNQPLASMFYDEYVRQNKLIDKNAGVINYTYNAFGELQHQDDNNGSFNFEYDKLGRILFKKKAIDNSIETSYLYWENGSGINQLKSIIGNGNSQNFIYDALGRLKESKDVIDGNNYFTGLEYDDFSNVSKITYPSGFFITKEYDETTGYLKKVKNPLLANPVFEAVEMNALGQYTEYYQNNILTEKTYNPFGLLEHSIAETFFHLENNWDNSTGNLNWRQDYINNSITESFDYDNLNRLTGSYSTVDGIDEAEPSVFSYYPNGNIQSKSRIGNFRYESDQLNAVEQVGNTSGDISSFIQDITYTPFNKCSTITENNKFLALSYGPDNQRRKSVLSENGADIKTIIYSRNYEKIIIQDPDNILPDKTYELHYISCGAGLVGIAVKEDGGTAQFFNVYTDHLGSILKLRKPDGSFEYEQNFDAWGRERNPADWSYNENPEDKPAWLIRGFTGHEHLDEFALINMNGRVYDPLLGRMLSADNYVQNPFGTQEYNRYSYALNNPLKYTDPDGEYAIVDDIIAAAIGGIVNLGVNAIQGNLSDHGFWGGFGRGAAAFGAGAVGGWGALYPEFGGWIWGGATVGATNAWLSGATTGGEIAQGAMVGAIAGVAGGAAGTAAAQGAGVLASSIASPVARGAIAGIAGGAVGGYAGGFTAGFIMTDDLGAANQAGLQGLWTGAAIGGVAGGIGGYRYSKTNNLNPWTGRSLNVELMKPIGPSEISLGRYENKQIRSNVSGDFDVALGEYNNIRNQYGLGPVNNAPSSFSTTLPDGRTVSGNFYYGGNQNPTGYNIKIFTNSPPTINKVPPVYIRYNNW